MHTHALPAPSPHRVTAQEFLRMAEAGVLDPEARIELIEGQMIDIPARAIWVHRDPEDDAYRRRFELAAPYRISLAMLDGVELELGGLVSEAVVRSHR